MHTEGPGACCLPWPKSLQRCFTDFSYVHEGQFVTWHALGYCTPDIIYALRRACGSPWQADRVSGNPLTVAPLTPTAIAAFTAWFEGTGQLRVGENYHPSVVCFGYSRPENGRGLFSIAGHAITEDMHIPPARPNEPVALAPVWFAGDVRHIPALLALRNRLLNPQRYP